MIGLGKKHFIRLISLAKIGKVGIRVEEEGIELVVRHELEELIAHPFFEAICRRNELQKVGSPLSGAWMLSENRQ